MIYDHKPRSEMGPVGFTSRSISHVCTLCCYCRFKPLFVRRLKGKVALQSGGCRQGCFFAIAHKWHTCSHMRVLPAHLAFIFVAQEYLNSAESKKRLCCFRPRWMGCCTPREEFSERADFLLPCIPRVTYQRLLVGTCLYFSSSLKGVRFDRISLCKGPCCSSLSLSKSGSRVVAVLKKKKKAAATQTSAVAEDECAGKAWLMHLPEENNDFRKGEWVREMVLC